MKTIATPLLLATCRAQPDSADEHNHVPLPAGQYRLAVIERQPAHKPTLDDDWCDCHTCEQAPQYRTRSAVPALPTGDVAIIVHGFNCTEGAGIETAFHLRDALVAWDVTVCAPHAEAGPGDLHVMGFTWPCEHTLFPGYMADKEAVARFGAFSLANLLIDLRRANPGRRIHLIAHSMGCFLTLKALNMLAVLHLTPEERARPLVDDVIWLAPDINADALEASTPQSAQIKAWQHPGLRLPFSKTALALARPKPVQTPPVAVTVNGEHPLDGYGYAALDVVARLSIYCSLHDEALWASPLANHVTEESGSAAGSIRLGWCGPLHPGLMMLRDTGVHRQRQVTLVDCSDVVFEHGAYFFVPVTQRDLAARITATQGNGHQMSNALTKTVESRVAVTIPEGVAAQPVRLPKSYPTKAQAVTPPPERVMLTAWHVGAPLEYPGPGETCAAGLTMYALRAPQTDDPDATQPRANAPVVPTDGIDAIMPGLWRFPLSQPGLKLLVWFWCWYYRVGNRATKTAPRT